MWVYTSGPGGLFTVGYLLPSGAVEPVEFYDDAEDAREAVHFLNGGASASDSHQVVEILREIRSEIEWATAQR